MAVIVGSFLTQDEAEQAYVQLRNAGYADENLALISNVTNTVRGSESTAVDAADVMSIDERESEATGPSLLTPEATGQSEEKRVDAAALGAAIGLMAGGGLFGPIGAIVGTAAGGGIGAALASRGMHQEEAAAYAAHLREGRYLVAVETDAPDVEVRAIMDEAGAGKVRVAG
jgi:hypothetical protein